VFTFALRPSGHAVRVALNPAERRPATPEGDRDAVTELILSAPVEALFDVRVVDVTIPCEAVIRESVTCAGCGEPVMDSRTVDGDGGRVCIPCAERGRQGGT
jgi:formylmethanofuran dehydrogenase subunit E